MARRVRATAVSAIVITLALGGVGVVGAAPFMTASANAAGNGVRVAKAVPSQLGPSDNAGFEEPVPEDPVVTVTVTTTPPEAPPPEEEPGPTDVTKTVTVTPKAKKPKAPKPAQPTPTQQPVAPPPPTQQPVQPPPVPPAQTTNAPPPVLPAETEEALELPVVPEVTTSAPPAPSPSTSLVEPAEPDSVPVELREAAPEYDQQLVSRQLGIPALILVLLALFAVLIFEGRLRRMAHAAAVRRAGPRPPGRHRGDVSDFTPYPAGAVYQQSPYGPAYAPIITYVPVHPYAPPPQGAPAVNHPPNHPPAAGPPPRPGPHGGTRGPGPGGAGVGPEGTAVYPLPGPLPDSSANERRGPVERDRPWPPAPPEQGNP